MTLIGFEGVNLDRPKSYIEIGAGSSKKRIDFDVSCTCFACDCLNNILEHSEHM